MLNKSEWITKINFLAANKIPFLFIIDFLKQYPCVIPLTQINPTQIKFQTQYYNNINSEIHKPFNRTNTIKPVSLDIKYNRLENYKIKFDQAVKQIKYGNSYLLNLCLSTPIKSNYNLEDIFYYSKAKYKLLYHNEFVVFSPETFIEIKDHKIYTYPMKGTINLEIENAEQLLLNNNKEKYEHSTIVDLLRNDLGMVADNIKVEKYRYTEKIKTYKHNLLQISSKISGQLAPDYYTRLGDIFDTLLPAGSVTGAPKSKTIEIILEIEKENRNFYTGVFGIFDGENVDAAVMIRFIENKNNLLFYRSGGGITAQSNLINEYKEINDKIYVPIY